MSSLFSGVQYGRQQLVAAIPGYKAAILELIPELLRIRVKIAEDAINARVRAIQICSRLNTSGDWVEPPKHLIFSSGPKVVVAEPEAEPESRTEPTPVRTSTDEPEPHFLLDTTAIRK